MCIMFTLYLIFKPLRTHPGELLMFSAFFVAYWLFYMYTDPGSFFIDKNTEFALKFVHFFYGKLYIYIYIYYLDGTLP